MSAISIRYRVELSLNCQKKTYDSDDSTFAVGNSNKSKVIAKKIDYADFFLLKDYKAQQKLTKSREGISLKDVVSVEVKHGQFMVYTKSVFEIKTK